MRLVTIVGGHPGALLEGGLVDGGVVDLVSAGARAGVDVRTTRQLLADLDLARRALDAATADDRVAAPRLLPPVPDPTKIICVGRNYGAHAAEIGAERPAHPIWFSRFTQTLVGPTDPVVAPKVSAELDWEGELAVVIGRTCRHLDAGSAMSAIAGYAVFNDLSVRDFQLRTPQYTPGKNFDATAPFGPAVVTADEIGDPHDLLLETLVGDEVVQSANTGEMLFSIVDLLVDASQWTTLHPGDVIATGTPAGVGGLRTPPRFLHVGETVTVRISGLGEIANPVVAEA